VEPSSNQSINADAETDPEQNAPSERLSQLPDAISAPIERSQAAFQRDLPELLKTKGRFRQWVAYHGDRRVGFAKTKTELYQACLRQGLRRAEFVVRSIEPEVPQETEIPLDI
jgi:hypothetical protein